MQIKQIDGTSVCNEDFFVEGRSTCVHEFFPIYQVSTTTPTSTATTTLPNDAEIAIVVLLLVLIIAHVSVFLIYALSNVYKKRKYLQYGGGDVEIREDI